jgi:signal transduction histidine kinase
MDLHPAHQLLALLVIALHIVLPLGTWAMLSGYRDEPARIWLVGIACYCVGAMLAALNTLSYSNTKFIVLALFYLASILLMLEALTRDLHCSKRPTWVLLVVLAIGGIYFSAITYQGLFSTVGLMSVSTMFLIFGFFGIGLTLKLVQRHQSRSMVLVALALGLMASGHLLRLFMMAWGAPPTDFQVAAFTWNSNYLVLTTVITMILISFGYWGYVLDKLHLKNKHVQAQQMAAEMLAQKSQELLKERDQLMMLNARVSAISSLSSFSAMLVHDISQPLQALEFGLYELQSQATPDQTADHLLHNIHELQQLSSKAGEMVSHLRQLMGRGQDHVSAIDPHMALQPILPILQGEALQRGITLSYTHRLPGQARVMANAVMLQRIVFNAVGNALDALQDHPKAQACIQIQLYTQVKAHEAWVVLEIADNGPGFSADVLSQLSAPIQSTKPHGMGLGLMLTQSMVRMWGGHTQIDNQPAGQPPGGLLQIWLRTATDEKSI